MEPLHIMSHWEAFSIMLWICTHYHTDAEGDSAGHNKCWNQAQTARLWGVARLYSSRSSQLSHSALVFHLFSFLHRCCFSPTSYLCFPPAPDQGEAICRGNPSLILAQSSWKMYSRLTVGRCRLALGPQQEPSSALMEHYFAPCSYIYPSIFAFSLLLQSLTKQSS